MMAAGIGSQGAAAMRGAVVVATAVVPPVTTAVVAAAPAVPPATVVAAAMPAAAVLAATVPAAAVLVAAVLATFTSTGRAVAATALAGAALPNFAGERAVDRAPPNVKGSHVPCRYQPAKHSEIHLLGAVDIKLGCLTRKSARLAAVSFSSFDKFLPVSIFPTAVEVTVETFGRLSLPGSTMATLKSHSELLQLFGKLLTAKFLVLPEHNSAILDFKGPNLPHRSEDAFLIVIIQ